MKDNKQQPHKVGALVKVGHKNCSWETMGLGVVMSEAKTFNYFDLDGTGTLQSTSQFVYFFGLQKALAVFVEYIHPIEKGPRT